jgi:hypothetical protein
MRKKWFEVMFSPSSRRPACREIAAVSNHASTCSPVTLNCVARSSAPSFLPETVGEVLDQACRAVGLDPVDAVLLRLGENMLYQLKSAPVVVRIARGMEHWDDATKEVAVAGWLASQQFPAAQLRDVGEQPIEVDGHPVTFWRLISGREAHLDETDILGGLLRQLHQLDRPANLTLPAVQAFGHVSTRLATARIPARDADFLRQRVAEVEQDLLGVKFTLPTVALHGDAHIKNVMITDSAAMLIDLEAFAEGPAEWDLAKTAAETSMGMHSERNYASFVDGYGYDITTWSGWPVLQAIQQLKMVTWLSQNIDHSARIRSEYEKRITTLRTGVLSEPWCGA